MPEQNRFTVPEGVSHARIDKVLTDAFSEFSRADFHRAFESKGVFCNGQDVSKSKRVSVGDEIAFSMPEIRELDMNPVSMELKIVFEDEYIVVVDKPAGIVVHPGAGVYEPTLVHGLLHHCAGQLSGIGGVERPGIVHRLDRETSGLIVVAKTDKAHRSLSEQFQSRVTRKEYLALVSGQPELISGSIKAPIERHPAKRHKMHIAKRGEGKEAHTDWKLEKGDNRGYSLFRCRIHTGRTHQIRVHLKSIGHSILGDAVYGYRPKDAWPKPPRVMLHSCYLGIDHPVSGERQTFKADLPEDFRAFVASDT